MHFVISSSSLSRKRRKIIPKKRTMQGERHYLRQKAVLRDKTLTKADQPIVDMAYENLKEAVDALVLSGKTDPVTKVMTGIKITALHRKQNIKWENVSAHQV